MLQVMGILFLYLAGTYVENIFFMENISLIGEDMITTIIDGNQNGSVVTLGVII